MTHFNSAPFGHSESVTVYELLEKGSCKNNNPSFLHFASSFKNPELINAQVFINQWEAAKIDGGWVFSLLKKNISWLSS